MQLFDLTKNVRLEGKFKKIYERIQLALVITFFLGYVAAAYLVLFPYKFSNYSAENPNGGTIVDLTKSGEANVYSFFSKETGQFSKANVQFTFFENSPQNDAISVEIRKSYQAFFAPIGTPVGFPDGYLVEQNNSFFIISNGKAREFESTTILQSLGYQSDVFIKITSDELAKHQQDQKIVLDSPLPDGMLFRIDESYYQLKNGQLLKFISENAFTSRFPKSFAISKDNTLFEKYPLSDGFIGFPDGTLISSPSAIYVVSGDTAYSFLSPEMFLEFGYDFSNVKKVNEHELSFYKKTNALSKSAVHPDGTIFIDSKNNTQYLFINNQKHPLTGENIISAYANVAPINTTSDSLNVSSKCSANKQLLFENFSCSVKINPISNFQGNVYSFTVNSSTPMEFEKIQVIFSRNISKENIVQSLSEIRNRIALRLANINK